VTGLAPDLAARITSHLDRVYAGGTVLGDDDRPHPIGVTSVGRGKGEFVAGVVRSERPHSTLEIGMAWGVSTLFILRALLENGDRIRPHVVIDPFQSRKYHNAATRSLSDLGIANLAEFHEEPSELALPQLVREGRQFDLAFIDGGHAFDQVFTDLRYVHLLLRPGGVAIFDDADWDSVLLACRFAEDSYGYQPIARHPAAARTRIRLRSRRRASLLVYRKPVEAAKRKPAALVGFLTGFKPGRRIHVGGLRRTGLDALAAGDRLAARRIFVDAIRREPTRFKTYLRLLRTYLPPRLARALSAKKR
jgi:predicted O-methyltransferase YrrM